MKKYKTVNSLSGGESSSYMAVHYPADYNVFALVCIEDKECTPADKGIVDYVNYKLEKYIPEYGEFIATAEDDRVLYAMRDLEQLLGKEIIWVRGKSFDRVIDTKNTHGGIPTRLPGKLFRICTQEMKLVPIFLWWFYNIGVKCEMRIGFRFDEFTRIENFFNNGSPQSFQIPVYTRNYGSYLQVHQDFLWRKCTFPLAKDAREKHHIKQYWSDKDIDFPEISNCINCFWKKIETLAAMALIHPKKMNWAAGKEQLGKGTWKEGEQYEDIIQNAKSLAKEYYAEIMNGGDGCDSGGCTA